MRTGYVGIVGPANTGRSSLLNALVGKRISPVSKQPGTTRVPLTGLLFKAPPAPFRSDPVPDHPRSPEQALRVGGGA